MDLVVDKRAIHGLWPRARRRERTIADVLTIMDIAELWADVHGNTRPAFGHGRAAAKALKVDPTWEAAR